MEHKSVLFNEAINYLKCEEKNLILDCTIGGAGHAKEILKRLPPGGKLIGIDRDDSALKLAQENLKDFEGSFKLAHGNFRDFDRVLKDFEINAVDGMLFDLGVSSFQFDAGERGFSFSKDATLDMRMDNSEGEPLWRLLNKMDEQQLGDIIRDLGEERYWRKIAKAIIRERKASPIKETSRLSSIIRGSMHYNRRMKIDPATRTFQALRIFVNDELGAIEQALNKVSDYLNRDARIVVISFHSLEDRIVKHSFKDLKQEGLIDILTKKPIRPSEAEVDENPRSRSAKLRAAQRV